MSVSGLGKYSQNLNSTYKYISYLISLLPKISYGVFFLLHFIFTFHFALLILYLNKIAHQANQQSDSALQENLHRSHSFSNKSTVNSVKDNIYHGIVQVSHSRKHSKQGNTVVKSIAWNIIMLSNGTHCSSRDTYRYFHILYVLFMTMGIKLHMGLQQRHSFIS